MKKWMWIAILVLLIILLSCKKQNRGELTSLEKAQKKEEIFPVAELVRNKILAAREEFKKGNADKGVILLLESLQYLGPRTD